MLAPAGDINYSFADKKLVGEIYFPPVILFANSNRN